MFPSSSSNRIPFRFREGFLVLAGCAAITGCAAVGPPPGGPEDKTPPTLESVDPPSGSTRIEPGLTVRLVFSERLDLSAREKGVRIAPALKDPLRISLRKEQMRVVFPGELAENQTYILTATRDILDEHGNRLDQTYQMAFSTGETISEGTISGSVFDAKGASTVYLYRVDERGLDSLFLEPPDYYTQTDDSGRFGFSFLEPGSYQVLAFRGGSPPAPIVPSRMPYGVHWDVPIVLGPGVPRVKHVNMRVSPEPPPLRVISVGMETRRLGIVRLTHPVSLGRQDTLVLAVEDIPTQQVFHPDFLFQVEDPSSEFRFRVSGLIPGGDYTLFLTGLTDLMDRVFPSFQGDLQVPEREADTLRIVDPEPNGSIRLRPGEARLEIQFSDAVDSGSFRDALQLLDTSGTALPAITQWANPTRVQLMPEDGWMEEQDYRVRLLGHLVHSDRGVALKDSVVSFPVKVGLKVGEGGLEGSVTGKYAENSVVLARALEKPSISYHTAVNSQGSFEFENIPSGFWLLSVYQDRDRNGRHTRGSAVPFLSSEPFHPFSDTLEVRANWTVQGLRLAYPGQGDEE
ncbi:MAG: Ig-like domain-containing protein [Fidelibacterota bacterium]